MESINLRSNCVAQIVARVRRIAKDIGRTPTVAETGPSIQNAINRGGMNGHPLRRSWSDILTMAGLEPRAPGGAYAAYTREVLVELLRDFYATNKRLPGRSDWRGGHLPSEAPYYRVFGDMLNAYEAAGLIHVAMADSRRSRWA